MKINALQQGKFGSNFGMAKNPIAKNYSVLVNGQKYVVSDSPLMYSPLGISAVNSAPKQVRNKLNVIA